MKYCSIAVVHYSQPDDSSASWIKSSADPKYHRSNLIRRCLSSLEENTDYPAELIVVDNGGRDDDSTYLLDNVRNGKINTYIRNKNNLNFGWSWNMAKRIASGDYLCLTCNDLHFEPGWLTACIELFEKYSNGKIFVSPYLSENLKINAATKTLADGTRIYAGGGSNCIIGTKDMFDSIGDFSTSNIAGSHWVQKSISMGYTFYFPAENYAEDMGRLGGQNYRIQTKIKKVLMKGEVVDYTYNG